MDLRIELTRGRVEASRVVGYARRRTRHLVARVLVIGKARGLQPLRDGSDEAKSPFTSTKGAAPARTRNVPSRAISLAAAMKPPHAARASAPPTLILRTPSAASSATVVKSAPTRTFTGLGETASTTARISSFALMPGA